MRRLALGLSLAFVLLLSFFFIIGSTPAQAYCVCHPYHGVYGGVYGRPWVHPGWGRPGWGVGGWRWRHGVRDWGRPGWGVRGVYGAPGVGRYGSGLGWRPGYGVGAPGFGWRRGREW